MSGSGAKEKSRPPTGVTGTSRPSTVSTVSHKAKPKKDNVDLKSKEEEYRFVAMVACIVVGHLIC